MPSSSASEVRGAGAGAPSSAPSATPTAAPLGAGLQTPMGGVDCELAQIQARYQARWTGGGGGLSQDQGKDDGAQLIPLTTFIHERERAERRDAPKWKCALCDLECNSKEHLATHTNGRPHKRREALKNKDDSLQRSFGGLKDIIRKVELGKWHCIVCNNDLPSDSVEAHVEGKGHRNKIRVHQSNTHARAAAGAGPSAPRSPRNAPRSPRNAPRSPRNAPRSPRNAPRSPRSAPPLSPRSESGPSRQEVRSVPKRTNQNQWSLPPPYAPIPRANAISSRPAPLLAFPEVHPQAQPRTELSSGFVERRFVPPQPAPAHAHAAGTHQPSQGAPAASASFSASAAAASSSSATPAASSLAAAHAASSFASIPAPAPVAAIQQPIRILARPTNTTPQQAPPMQGSPRLNANAKEFNPSPPSAGSPSPCVAPTSTSAPPVFRQPANVQQLPGSRPLPARTRPVLQPSHVATQGAVEPARHQQPPGGNFPISRSPQQQQPLAAPQILQPSVVPWQQQPFASPQAPMAPLHQQPFPSQQPPVHLQPFAAPQAQVAPQHQQPVAAPQAPVAPLHQQPFAAPQPPVAPLLQQPFGTQQPMVAPPHQQPVATPQAPLSQQPPMAPWHQQLFAAPQPPVAPPQHQQPFAAPQPPLSHMYQSSWQYLTQSATGSWEVMPAGMQGDVPSRLRADARPFMPMGERATVGGHEDCGGQGLTSRLLQVLADNQQSNVSPIVEEAAATPMVDAPPYAGASSEVLPTAGQSNLAAATSPQRQPSITPPSTQINSMVSRAGSSSAGHQGDVGRMSNLPVGPAGRPPALNDVRPLQLIGNTQAGASAAVLHSLNSQEDTEMSEGVGEPRMGAVPSTPPGYGVAATPPTSNNAFTCPPAGSNRSSGVLRVNAPSPQPQQGQKKKKKSETFYCELCDVNCTSEYDLRQHILSAKHLRRLSGPAQPSDMFYCSTCGVEVCGKNNWESHVAGQKHQKKQAQAHNAANVVG